MRRVFFQACLAGFVLVAAAGCAILGAKEPLAREAVEKAIGSIQADAVLATRPLGGSTQLKEGGTHESRGDAYYKATDVGYGYGYGYYGMYGVPVVYGEFQSEPAEFYLEGGGKVRSEIYDTARAAMVYSVETEAKRLESRSRGLVVVTSSIATDLRKAGLVR